MRKQQGILRILNNRPARRVKASAVISTDPTELLPKSFDQKSMERLFHALRRRDKIVAIKEVRALLGIGLKEAKDFCEQHFFDPAPDVRPPE